MAHTIHLIKEHKEVLLEALIQSMEIKEKKLQNVETIDKMKAMYCDAAEKLLQPVECGRINHNLFTWLIDQIKHSGRLYTNELGQYAITICQAANEDRYKQFINPLPDLFEIHG